MTIREQIEDVKLLMGAGRFKGALTILMSAIAASSRKALPKKQTKSIENPGSDMGDGEAFKYFLGGRICRIMAGDPLSREFGFSGFSFSYRGNNYSLEHILYKFFRCELIHNGDIPEDVIFLPEEGMPEPGSTKISLTLKNELALTYPWLIILIRVVTEAKCNREEFGVEHYDLVLRAGASEDEVIQKFKNIHGISLGRFYILRTMVYLIREYDPVLLSDERIQLMLANLLETKMLNGGQMSGLSIAGIVDDQNAFTPSGLARFRDVAALYFVQKA